MFYNFFSLGSIGNETLLKVFFFLKNGLQNSIKLNQSITILPNIYSVSQVIFLNRPGKHQTRELRERERNKSNA